MDLNRDIKPKIVSISQDEHVLSVEWGDGNVTEHDTRMIEAFTAAACEHHDKCDDIFGNALRADQPFPSVPFERVVSSDEGVFEWLSKLHQHGACVVSDTPTEPNRVTQVAERISQPMHTIYGTQFDVRVEAQPINIAYTDHKLREHLDLPYYESPPGVQFLHCIEFDEVVQGGESTFFDTYVLAEIMRQRYPREFEVLTRVPATFQKNHVERSSPVQLIYRSDNPFQPSNRQSN